MGSSHTENRTRKSDMSPPDDDQSLRKEAVRQRRIAIGLAQKEVSILLVSLILGFVVGSWQHYRMENNETSFVWGFGTVFAVWLVSLPMFVGCRPKCPKCGYSWIIDRGRLDLSKWKCCPSCGLEMREDS